MPVNTNNTTVALYAAAAAATVLSTTAVSLWYTRVPPAYSRKVIPSPRTTLLPHITSSEAAALGYPPDALPGARDVSTPYGYMRVYEWGPEDGRKVVLVHGDSTPSPLFGEIAKKLVGAGCRILTFDSWGRGYSDTPSQLQHDSRLYGHQILYAITSSPISWTGSLPPDSSGSQKRIQFSLVGFSLGGSISLDFFAHQPHLVSSIVLLGPAGLNRTLPPTYTKWLYRYPAFASASKMRQLMGELLEVDTSPVSGRSKSGSNDDVKASTEGFTPQRALQFQFDYHQGHVESRLSTVQYGPARKQYLIWERAGAIVRGQRWSDDDPTPNEIADDTPLRGGKILVICGADDNVVLSKDVREDLATYFGVEGDEGKEEKKHYVFKEVPGGHGFPWTAGEQVGDVIKDFWGL